MGRKIICEACNTKFDEDLLGNLRVCPVCGKSLLGDEVNVKQEEPKSKLSFGSQFKLGENDSFEEEKIDFWWYEIREPGTLNNNDKGSVSTTCARCGNLVGVAPYPVVKNGEYLLLDSRFEDSCAKCGNEMKNHILSKRPADYVDPRKLEMWTTDYSNMPKCPICSSTRIHKISMTNKAVSAVAFGFLAAGHVSKTYKCDICGAKF